MADKELKLFEEKNLTVFKQLAEFKKQQAEMESQEKKLKESLQKQMEEFGIKSFKNDLISITYVDSTETESIDLKRLSEKEPDLYNELLEDYRKVTTRSAFVRFTVK